MFLWPVIFVLGYYFVPLIGLWLWLRRIWALRSGWLRALAIAVIILTVTMSLNSQAIPSFNPHWLAVLGLALASAFNPHWLAVLGLALAAAYFLPNAPAYLRASQAVLLSISLALHLWYCYLAQRLFFDNQPSYYAAPCMAICFLLSLFALKHIKNQWMRLGAIGLALLLGALAGQYFYLNPY